MRRRLAILLIGTAVLLGLPVGQASAAVPASFVLSGSGWGHGVGMSQYGAYGQALAGRSATQILQHYYTGTSVVGVDDNLPLRVNLLHAVPSAQARVEGGAARLEVAAGTATLTAGADEVVSFGVNGTQVTVTKAGSPPAQADVVRLRWPADALLNLVGPSEALEGAGHRYRYGTVDLAVVGPALEAVNEVALHGEYLRGIAEVPSSWPTEALKAQVIAARTYALRKHQSGLRGECRCHVYDSVTDQVFAGWSKEAGDLGGRWVAAVDATQPSPTTGLAVLHAGAAISANYFSSSGGRTEHNEDGFGGSPLPYLRSVDDQWSLSSFNPRAAWSFTRTQAEVAAAFGLPDVVTIDLSARTPGGSVRAAVGRSSNGTTATLSGNSFRSKLGLPARWIRRPVVRVAGTDRYGTSVAIGQLATSTPTTVVLASGETDHLVDGLVGAPLARLHKAPLLLASAGGLPDAVAAEIDRLKPTVAYLVGGESALGAPVAAALAARGVATVKRLGGATRYDTGLAVARELGGQRNQAVIASGDAGHLVDALAVGGPAAASGLPILLVPRDSVPAPTAQALRELGVTTTVVVGGSSAVADATLAQLPGATRLAGADRYSTAVAVADNFSGAVGVSGVAVASGADENLVDALPGGALGQVTLLTGRTSLPASTRSWLTARVDVGTIHVLGGPAAVSDATFEAIRAAVGG